MRCVVTEPEPEPEPEVEGERERELHSVKKIRSSGAHVQHCHTRDENKLDALIIIN